MAFNYEKLRNNNISGNEYLVMLIVKEKDYESLADFDKEILELLENGWLTVTKEFEGKPNKIRGLRNTKKANTLLVDVQSTKVTEESKQLCEELIEIYTHKGYEKKIGNRKKILELCSWFLDATEEVDSIEYADIIETVENYLNAVEEKYVSALENLIWKPKSVFATKWTLGDSKLFNLLTNY